MRGRLGFSLLAWKLAIFLGLMAVAAKGQDRPLRPYAPVMPPRPSVSQAVAQRSTAARPIAYRTVAPDLTPSFNYYGGPVISNAEIVVVFWGSDVDPSTMSGIGGFYRAVLDSPVMDLLGEYDTLQRSPGTNQTIGHGSLKGTYTITPSQGNSGASLSDGNIQNELRSQVNNGVLPAPTFDAGGYPNTIYMIYFPPGIAITGAGSSGRSCVNFCGYHSITYSPGLDETKDLRYGVFPDFGTTSACSSNCARGIEATGFDNLTSVSTHELAETVTDGVGGTYAQPGPPTGWYSFDYDEIADICNGLEANGASGYTVQLIWSNLQGQCAQGPTRFAVAAPSVVIPGTSFTLTVTAEDSNGRPLNNYGGIATFSSSDGAASLPSDYLFDYSGASSGFAITLRTAGAQTIAVSDTRALTVKGFATVNVVQPINVSVGTQPSEASFSIDGVTYTSAQVLSWIPGSTHTLQVDSPQGVATAEQFVFLGWSDGGAAAHTVIAPNAPATFTALFDEAINPQRPDRTARDTTTNSTTATTSNVRSSRGSRKVLTRRSEAKR